MSRLVHSAHVHTRDVLEVVIAAATLGVVEGTMASAEVAKVVAAMVEAVRVMGGAMVEAAMVGVVTVVAAAMAEVAMVGVAMVEAVTSEAVASSAVVWAAAMTVVVAAG